jgi:Domain of unknown function (DUF4352)
MGAILLLMTIGGLIIALILLALAFLKKITWLKHFVLGGITVWFSFYVIIFLMSSIFSVEKTLGLNEPKEFCGFYLDCHLNARISDVRRSKTFGRLTAQNEFLIAKVKISNDARREALALITPKFTVIDDQGRQFSPTEDLSVSVQTPPFEEKIPAGQSIEGEIAFDLPPDAKNTRLDIREGYGIDHAIEAILVGDEDSFWHKRSYFKLAEQSQTVSVK